MPSDDWPILQQTPASSGIWENCEFFVNSPIPECDYWVVLDDVQYPETTICPNGNTLLITGEPPDIKKYNRKFTSQFGNILSCNPAIKHKNLLLSQQALPWHVGRKQISHKNLEFTKSYDELKKIRKYQKNKLISVIVSDKVMSDGHRQRIEFVSYLKTASGIEIDFFGRGFKEIEDKWDAIYPYKYHIVLENCSYPHYWTEKLTDCFMGGAYPLYFGCPNIHEYFSQKSMTTIDIFNMEQARKGIEQAIETYSYENSIIELAKAKDLCLDKYNLFAVVSRLAKQAITSDKKPLTTMILPEAHFQKHIGPINLIKKPIRKIKSALRRVQK